MKSLLAICLAALFLHSARGQNIELVPVDNGVTLEVLDWGGSGRPLVLLSGLGDTAHVFDQFAPKLTGSYHVFGITRRGFGASSSPAPSGNAYSADRLADDVLAVIDRLKLDRPVLVGHSIAGEELSSIGSRHPEKVAGLVYLDAAYGYAFYDRSRGDLYLDLFELEKKLESLQPGKGPNDTTPVIRDLLSLLLPQFQEDLKHERDFLQALPPDMLTGSSTSMPAASQAIIAGEQKYTDIKAPVLAIFAVPHDMGFEGDSGAKAAFDTVDEASSGAQMRTFEKGVPSARVVRLPHANHYVFRSNESDVLREMDSFIGKLP